MRTLVTADIHGGYKTLIQCFERSKFDYKNDRLIVLGDVCDGWDQTKKVINELLKIKNLIFIIGNHDVWVLDWMEDDKHIADNMLWIKQGGRMTLKSYDYDDHLDIPASHIDFLKNKSHLYYEEDGKLFVHGGIIAHTKVQDNAAQDILWNRTLSDLANKQRKAGINKPLTPYKEVWIGHTSTCCYGKKTPIINGGVINIDTGGGYEGKLTIMDLDTKEYWQSDKAFEIYFPDDGKGSCKWCGNPTIYKDRLCKWCWDLDNKKEEEQYGFKEEYL